MRAASPWLAALVTVLAATAWASANPPYPCSPLPQAPDYCQQGFYAGNYGNMYGPNNVYPPFHPYQGPCPPACRPNFNQPRFVTHSHARSPRDFFMMDP
jgi:hypothetical protein